MPKAKKENKSSKQKEPKKKRFAAYSKSPVLTHCLCLGRFEREFSQVQTSKALENRFGIVLAELQEDLAQLQRDMAIVVNQVHRLVYLASQECVSDVPPPGLS